MKKIKIREHSRIGNLCIKEFVHIPEQYQDKNISRTVLEKISSDRYLAFDKNIDFDPATIVASGFIQIKNGKASRDCIRAAAKQVGASFPKMHLFAEMYVYLNQTKKNIVIPERCWQLFGAGLPPKEGHLVLGHGFHENPDRSVFYKYVKKQGEDEVKKEEESFFFHPGTIVPIIWRR
jgi:hypothetical protein